MGLRRFGFIALAALVLSSQVSAATYYWTGKNGSGADSWNVQNNWGSTFNVSGNAGLNGSTSADNIVVDGNNTNLKFAGTTIDDFGQSSTPNATFNTLSIVSSGTNTMAVSVATVGGVNYSLTLSSSAATGNLGNGLPGNTIHGNLIVGTGGTLSFNAGANTADLNATVSTTGGTATLQGAWTATGTSAAITNTSGSMTLTGITLTGFSAAQTLLSGAGGIVVNGTNGTNTFK